MLPAGMRLPDAEGRARTFAQLRRIPDVEAAYFTSSTTSYLQGQFFVPGQIALRSPSQQFFDRVISPFAYPPNHLLVGALFVFFPGFPYSMKNY